MKHTLYYSKIKKIIVYLLIFTISFVSFRIKSFAIPNPALFTILKCNWDEPNYSNGNLILHVSSSFDMVTEGYAQSYFSISVVDVPVKIKINNKYYPNSLSDLKGASSGVLNYDGIQVKYTTDAFLGSDSITFGDGEKFEMDVIIPHGSNLNISNGEIYYEISELDSQGRVSFDADKQTQNISEKFNHIKNCTNKTWQKTETQHWQQCLTCGYMFSEKKNHKWETIKQETCTEDGSKKCIDCGQTAITTQLGHDYSTAWSKDDTAHWHKCTRCTEIKDKAEHNLKLKKEPTCSVPGLKECAICKESVEIPALKHH